MTVFPILSTVRVAGALAKIMSAVDRPYHYVSMACKLLHALCKSEDPCILYDKKATMKIANNLMQNDRVKPIQSCTLLDPSSQKDKLAKVFI